MFIGADVGSASSMTANTLNHVLTDQKETRQEAQTAVCKAHSQGHLHVKLLAWHLGA